MFTFLIQVVPPPCIVRSVRMPRVSVGISGGLGLDLWLKVSYAARWLETSPWEQVSIAACCVHCFQALTGRLADLKTGYCCWWLSHVLVKLAL